jgi:flotillin
MQPPRFAAADAEQTRLRARGDADAARYEAEAEGLRKVLQSKADGYRALVESCGGDARAAASLLMIEKIEHLVEAQVEAIKAIKIDKITVWDGGGGAGGGSATSNFASSLIESLPPLHEMARMAGLELPEYLDEQQKPAPAAPTDGASG